MATKISVSEAANIFGVGDRRVRQLMKEFNLPYSGRGQIIFEEFAGKFIEKLKKDRDETPAGTRLLHAKREAIVALIDERRSRLIPLEDAEAAVLNVIEMVESAAAGTGRRASHYPETAQRIDDEIARVVEEARDRAGRVIGAVRRGNDPREAI